MAMVATPGPSGVKITFSSKTHKEAFSLLVKTPIANLPDRVGHLPGMLKKKNFFLKIVPYKNCEESKLPATMKSSAAECPNSSAREIRYMENGLWKFLG